MISYFKKYSKYIYRHLVTYTLRGWGDLLAKMDVDLLTGRRTIHKFWPNAPPPPPPYICYDTLMYATILRLINSLYLRGAFLMVVLKHETLRSYFSDILEINILSTLLSFVLVSHLTCLIGHCQFWTPPSFFQLKQSRRNIKNYIWLQSPFLMIFFLQ